ncbi:MAG TPA: AbrB/MazE/SpoVT family DNA-binding domain-containing protein [Rectinemataceae bacterium]|nr:AbrB/MazE/SpoVT family DNA-binding domain-containing protein [Rectinemataceae bacterium]
METTVTTKNMISIPQALAKRLGIRPGWKLDWREGENPDEILVRVIPDRAESARRLLGRGKALSPERDAVAELVSERENES